MSQLSEEQKMMTDNIRRAVKEKIAPVAAENDRTGGINPEIAPLLIIQAVGSNTAEVILEDVEVPQENLLGEEGK